MGDVAGGAAEGAAAASIPSFCRCGCWPGVCARGVLRGVARRNAKGVTAAEITNRWVMEKMAVNRAIQRLVDNSCVTRERDPEDRRSYRLTLTAKGRKLYEKIAPTANRQYNELMSAIDNDETDAMVRALQKIIQRAEQLS